MRDTTVCVAGAALAVLGWVLGVALVDRWLMGSSTALFILCVYFYVQFPLRARRRYRHQQQAIHDLKGRPAVKRYRRDG